MTGTPFWEATILLIRRLRGDFRSSAKRDASRSLALSRFSCSIRSCCSDSFGSGNDSLESDDGDKSESSSAGKRSGSSTTGSSSISIKRSSSLSSTTINRCAPECSADPIVCFGESAYTDDSSDAVARRLTMKCERYTINGKPSRFLDGEAYRQYRSGRLRFARRSRRLVKAPMSDTTRSIVSHRRTAPF